MIHYLSLLAVPVLSFNQCENLWNEYDILDLVNCKWDHLNAGICKDLSCQMICSNEKEPTTEPTTVNPVTGTTVTTTARVNTTAHTQDYTSETTTTIPTTTENDVNCICPDGEAYNSPGLCSRENQIKCRNCNEGFRIVTTTG